MLNRVGVIMQYVHLFGRGLIQAVFFVDDPAERQHSQADFDGVFAAVARNVDVRSLRLQAF